MSQSPLEVLAKALSILAPPRVYVPHMEQFGTITHRYYEGRLIDLRLDDGTCMQTLLIFTQSVEDAIYKEESAKSPLNHAQDRGTAETLKTLQLSLF